MFGRKKKDSKPLWSMPDPADYGINREDAQPDPYINPGREMKERVEDATYMIGTLDDGRVQLRVGYPSSVILTMNNVAVRKMIKLLEAAMLEEGDTSNEC